MMAQMTLTAYIVAAWSDAKAALAEMPLVRLCFHVFWLMGSLFLLIEHTPPAWMHPSSQLLYSLYILFDAYARLYHLVLWANQNIVLVFWWRQPSLYCLGYFHHQSTADFFSNGTTYLCGARLLCPIAGKDGRQGQGLIEFVGVKVRKADSMRRTGCWFYWYACHASNYGLPQWLLWCQSEAIAWQPKPIRFP